MKKKTCPSCQTKFFGKRSDAVFCSELCRNRTRQARWSAANPDRSKATWRKYACSDNGTAVLLLNYARDRAKRGNLAFDLDREFIARKLSNGVCELSGLPIERVSPGEYRTHPFAPSLDRIIPANGYLKSNVRLVCFAVNRARSDWGDEVLLKIAAALVKYITA
jgi:hypothetical protein